MRVSERRLGLSVVLLMASALTFFGILGEGSMGSLTLAQIVPMRTPIAGGGFAVAAMVVLIVINGLFIAGETAVETLRTLHVRRVRDENGSRAERLQELLANKQTYTTASLLASRIARVGLAFFVIVLAQGLALFLEKRAGWTFDYGSILLCVVLLGVPVVLVNLIVGELVPRSYAALHPHTVALRLYGLIRGAATVLSLPATALVGLASLFTNRFGGTAAFASANQAEEEIKTLVESAEETGQIESQERELIHSVFEFNDTVAREIMTPRVDLDAMAITSDPSEVVQVIEETGHSRIPLYEETDDQIVGIIHAKDLLLAMVEEQSVRLRDLMRPALFVPEGKSLTELLREMRTSRSQLAIVQDEFGGTAGIVTIEDIVEQLVGDIVDEYDVEEAPFVEVEGGWLVSGKSHLDDVNAKIGSTFESDEFDTVGGFVFGQFGRQPKQEEWIDIDGYRFEVVETDGRRVLRLKVRPSPPMAATT